MNTTPAKPVKSPPASPPPRRGITIPSDLHDRIAQAADRLGYRSPNAAAEQALRIFLDRPDLALEFLAESKADAQGVTPATFSVVADLLGEWRAERKPVRPPRRATVPDGSLPVFLSEALVVGMERLVVAAGLDDDEPFGLVGALVEAMVENTLADSGRPGGGFEVHMPDIWNLSDERKRDLERAAATQHFTPRDWEAGTPAKLVIEARKEAEMAPAQEEPAADLVPVHLPGWYVRLYESLAGRFGSNETLADFIMVMLQSDVDAAMEAEAGIKLGLVQAVMEEAQHSATRIDVEDILVAARAERAMAEGQKGGLEA